MPGPWEKYAASGAQVPQAGSPSPLTAPMAGMHTMPEYQSDDDIQAMMLDAALNEGKGMASIINQSPGHMQRKAYAEGIGKAQSNLAERQRAGMDVLSSLQQLVDTARASQQEDDQNKRGSYRLNEAIGPINDAGAQWGLPAPMMMKSQWNAPAYDLNNRLHHDIEGLTTSFIMSASKGGLNMSDARQKAFADTMGAMMKATNPEEFYKISKDAENIVRDSFGIPADAPLAPYTTQGKVLADQRAAAEQGGPATEQDYRMSFTPGAQQAFAAGKPEPITFKGLPKGWEIRKVR